MNRWPKLQTEYSDSGFVLRFTKLKELWAATMASSGNSMETYVANVRSKAKDLKRMGAGIEDWILVSVIEHFGRKVQGLYAPFITSLDVPEFDKTVTLLHEEERLNKRDNKDQAIAAAMKIFDKDEKKRRPPEATIVEEAQEECEAKGAERPIPPKALRAIRIVLTTRATATLLSALSVRYTMGLRNTRYHSTRGVDWRTAISRPYIAALFDIGGERGKRRTRSRTKDLRQFRS